MRLLIIDNNQLEARDRAIYNFVRVFANENDEIVFRYLDSFEKIDTLLGDAKDFDCVIPYGDDNTVTACCDALRYTKVPILPFPANDGNLLHLNLDLPLEPHSISDMLRENSCVDFDMGEIEYRNEKNMLTRKGFAVMAGAGYDASIIESANKVRKMLGPFAFLFAAFSHPHPPKAKIKLNVDGELIETEGIAVLLINFAKIAPDLSVTHINDARDGLLEVVVINSENVIELFPALFAAILDRTGKHPDRSSKLEVFVGSEISIDAIPPLSIQYDGITTDSKTPFKAKVLPESIRLSTLPIHETL
jgi:diacylglycerol kinase family enzyme